MLKIKGWLRAAALCVAFCLLLTGCSIPMPEETVQVEELLRAPRLAGDYGALQTALNDWLGESAQLKYPLQGDLLSPFVLQDFDGDGEPGRSGVLHHGPHLQCMRCFLTQEQRGRLAGEPDRRGPGRFGGQCPAGSASGGRHGPARRGLCGFAG